MKPFTRKRPPIISKHFISATTSFLCAVLLGLCAINRIATSTAAANHTEWSADTIVQQGQNEDQPVEQTRKNIQVLKGLPERQLFDLMNVVATSLDVQCDYCHVKNPGRNPQTGGDNWVWESDNKPKKLAGRRMMKMVLEINRTNFDGQTLVTCYTCHRGGTAPARLPALPPHQSTQREAAQLPTTEQILAKYVAAIGGKDVATKFSTTVMRGMIERSEGHNDDGSLIRRERPLQVTLKGSDKFLMTWTSPQGTTTAGLNGDVGWISAGAGFRKLTGRDLERARRTAAFYDAIKVVEQPSQMKVIGTEKIGDGEAYVVARIVDPDTTTKSFFDTQTGLLLRELTTTRTILVPLAEQIDFEDYRDVDGVKLPFTIRTSDAAPYATAIRRFNEIRHNVAVADEVFKLPTTPR